MNNQLKKLNRKQKKKFKKNPNNKPIQTTHQKKILMHFLIIKIRKINRRPKKLMIKLMKNWLFKIIKSPMYNLEKKCKKN